MDVDVPPAYDAATGMIDNSAYSSDVLYDRELQRVFPKTWLFVGHDSMIPAPHDFISTFMAEDNVVLTRDARGAVHVLLNKCRHRGNKVCMFDEGNATSFTCSFHGWSYASDGALTAVPKLKEVYDNKLAVDQLGLVEAPRVERAGGLIFASWDPDIPPLDAYLGDFRWYLDTFVENDEIDLEFVPGVQRYMMPVNWKLLADNFAGDDYHFAITHASVMAVMRRNPSSALSHGVRTDERYSVATNYRTGPSHGVLELKMGDVAFEEDLEQARSLGPEAVEWIEHRREVVRRRAGELGPYAFHTATIFPNVSLVGFGNALYARSFLLWSPRGPQRTEVIQWAAVDRQAPEVIKRRMLDVLMHRQAAAGLVAPDDHENFERISPNTATARARQVPFHYGMGIEDEEAYQAPTPWPAAEHRGRLFPRVTEASQREFYRYWQELMDGRGRQGAARDV